MLDDLLAAIDYRAHLFAEADDKVAAARWQNACDFVDWLKKRAEEDGSTLVRLAQTVSLLSQLDRKDSELDAVRLSTIHAAKGLEFPHVFVVGCEEGLLPHHGGSAGADEAPDGDGTRIEEERRLMYVAVTRAQRSLTLTWCRQRRRGKERYAQLPSRFLGEMQLEAKSAAAATVTREAGRAKLAGLRALLAQPGAARRP